MSTSILNGKLLKDMLIGGAENMRSNISEINDLNVFPVPDGDTGTNMTLTLEGGLNSIKNVESESIADVIDSFARGALLGARGNSGVILSQIFAGIKEELSHYERVSAIDLSLAYKRGIDKSYASVQNPTEGTILTVFREATEYAAERINEKSSIEDFYKLHIEEAKRSLERTKELLPVLREADVVDSGAAGYLCIAVGMYLALTGKIKGTTTLSSLTEEKSAAPDISRFTRESKLEFGYCTEFLLRLTDSKVDVDSFDIECVKELLLSLGGESIVAYKDGDIVKVHVHSFTPGKILDECQRFGEFLTVKIENMSLGHSGEPTPKKKDRAKLSVLTVATGEGMCSLFCELGADGVISGGQTQNPSTEEFIEAFREHDAENIIVLPNNKNVFLAAKQASELYDGANIHIIPTKTLMQGYGALQVITPGITDVDVLVRNIERAAGEVVGSEITVAVRDVTIGGKEVHAGDYIAITDGEITAVADSAEECVIGMLQAVENIDDYEILTLFVGKDVGEERRAGLTERLEELYPDFDVEVYIGGQEVYDYLVALE